MNTILSSELFKLKKDNAFKICAVIVVLLTIFTIAVEIIFQAVTIDSSLGIAFVFNGAAAPAQSLQDMAQTIVICVGVLAGTFICGEFENGCIRNTLSVGKSRVNYYFGKMYALLVASVIMAAVTIVLYLICMTVRFGWGADVNADYFINLFLLIGCEILIYLTYASIYIMFAFLCRNVGAVIGIAVSLTIVESIVIAVLALPIKILENIRFLQNAVPAYNIMRLNNAFNGSIDRIEFLWVAVICAVTIAVSTALGIWSFLKRDVK